MLEDNVLDIDMSIIAEYISEKYLVAVHIDNEDTLYITLNTGRIIVTYEELVEFLNSNQDYYVDAGWTWMDLIDVYILHCFISALNKLTNNMYQNDDTILQ